MSTEPTAKPAPAKDDRPSTPPLRQIASYERRDVRNAMAKVTNQ